MMLRKLALPIVFLASVAALAIALYMQHAKNLAPCTLCITQRYAFVFMALFSVATLLAGRCIKVRKLFVGLSIITALAGAGVAARNLWVIAHPDILCGRDPLELFLNDLPTAHWWPQVFVASGFCSDPIPPLLGLPLPAWSLLGLLGLTVLLGFAWKQRGEN